MNSLLYVLTDQSTDDASWRPHVLREWGLKVSPYCFGKELVCEPMSGLGSQGHYLASTVGADYFGFDIDPEVIDAAKAKKLHRASFDCLDTLTFPRLTRSADVMLLGYEAINAFPLPTQLKLLDWCASVCERKAILIVDFLSREAKLPSFHLGHSGRLDTFIRGSERLHTFSWKLPNPIPRHSVRYTPQCCVLMEKARSLGGRILTCHTSFSDILTTKQCLQQMTTLIVELP